MAKSSRRRSKSSMRKNLSKKELHSVVNKAKRKVKHSKKSSKKHSNMRKTKGKGKGKSKKSKSKKSKSRYGLKGGDGYRVDVTRSIAGKPIYQRLDDCVAPKINNLNKV